MKKLEKVTEIILHCTATPEGQDKRVEQIRQEHIKCNKWEDIGYHYVVELSGVPRAGRSTKYQGAHCVDHGKNACSIGVAYVGGVDKAYKHAKDTRNEEQKHTMYHLVMALLIKYNLHTDAVHGHCEYAKKACPSFDVKAFVREMEDEMQTMHGMGVNEIVDLINH